MTFFTGIATNARKSKRRVFNEFSILLRALRTVKL